VAARVLSPILHRFEQPPDRKSSAEARRLGGTAGPCALVATFTPQDVNYPSKLTQPAN